MAKAADAIKDPRGLKRICASCGTRFYDMNKRPIACPSCSAEFTGEIKVKTRRGRAAIATEGQVDEKTAKDAANDDDTEDDDIIAEDDVVSLEDAEADDTDEDEDDLPEGDLDLDDLEDDDLEDEDDLEGLEGDVDIDTDSEKDS